MTEIIEDKETRWYLQSIEREIVKLCEGRFFGSINFEVHFQDGHARSMKINLHKSIKFNKGE